jgi:hypothetical protein
MLDGASSKDTHLEQINTCNGRAVNESGTLRSEFTKDGYHSGEWSPPLQRKNREFSFDRLGGFHRIAQLGLVVIGGFPNVYPGPHRIVGPGTQVARFPALAIVPRHGYQ